MLQPPSLVVEVVEAGAVGVEEAERVPGEDVAGVVADGFDGGGAGEEHALARGQAGDLAGEHEGEDVEEEGLEPVGVDGAVGVRDVEAVVLRVHEPVEGAVDVAETVREVDPRVDDDEGYEVLQGWDEDVGGEGGEGEVERGEVVLGGGGHDRCEVVVAAADDAGEGWAGALGGVAELLGVDADGVQDDGDDTASVVDHVGGVVDSASLVTDHWWAGAVIEEQADGDLDDMITDDAFEAFPSGDVVPFQLVLCRMDSIVSEQFIGVEEVEKGAGNGINDGWQDDGKHVVADPWK